MRRPQASRAGRRHRTAPHQGPCRAHAAQRPRQRTRVAAGHRRTVRHGAPGRAAAIAATTSARPSRLSRMSPAVSTQPPIGTGQERQADRRSGHRKCRSGRCPRKSAIAHEELAAGHGKAAEKLERRERREWVRRWEKEGRRVRWPRRRRPRCSPNFASNSGGGGGGVSSRRS